MYNVEWFKKRALESLKKLEENSWDYSDSLLLYLPQGQQAYETAQVDDSPYFKLVTNEEHVYLVSVVEDIVKMLPEEFEYIDLGPGTEHKENYFFQELQKQNKKFTYIPVDISEYFLNIAKDNAEKQNIRANSILASFEELPIILSSSVVPRFVSLGQTLSNYESAKILNLLGRIAGKGGFIWLDMQLRERINIPKLQEIYQKYVAPACDQKLSLLGLKKDDISERIANDEIAITCKLVRVPPELENRGLKVGDNLRLFQSYRKTREQFEKDLQGLNYTFFDNGNSFVGCIIRS